MIYYEKEIHQEMAGKLLDEYLNRGWYRIGQTIITTDIIYSNSQYIPVFWFRLDLKKYTTNRESRRIHRKNNHYTVRIVPFAITEEIEDLFVRYRSHIDFHTPGTVTESLLDHQETNAYDTVMIEIRDKERLIALGYFDLGKKTIAAILHFYDPDYKKQSLGKYLMLLEIDYALKTKMDYYYPGYISTETPKYDYKLFPGQEGAEVFIRQENRWYPYLLAIKKIQGWSRMVTLFLNPAPEEKKSQ